MEVLESQNLRDARIEALWKSLDPQGKGELDINGLQKGLRKIDHPLKNASDLLRDVVAAMDKNGDHVISYEGVLCLPIPHKVSRLGLDAVDICEKNRSCMA